MHQLKIDWYVFNSCPESVFEFIAKKLKTYKNKMTIIMISHFTESLSVFYKTSCTTDINRARRHRYLCSCKRKPVYPDETAVRGERITTAPVGQTLSLEYSPYDTPCSFTCTWTVYIAFTQSYRL